MSVTEKVNLMEKYMQKNRLGALSTHLEMNTSTISHLKNENKLNNPGIDVIRQLKKGHFKNLNLNWLICDEGSPGIDGLLDGYDETATVVGEPSGTSGGIQATDRLDQILHEIKDVKSICEELQARK